MTASALGKTLGKDLGLTLDFSDEVTLLATRFLKDYKMLIMLRDGMVFPTGYGAGGGPGGRGVVSDPPLPPFEAPEVYWITPEEGKAVKDFVQGGGGARFEHNTTDSSPHKQDGRDGRGAVTREQPPRRPGKGKRTKHDHP